MHTSPLNHGGRRTDGEKKGVAEKGRKREKEELEEKEDASFRVVTYACIEKYVGRNDCTNGWLASLNQRRECIQKKLLRKMRAKSPSPSIIPLVAKRLSYLEYTTSSSRSDACPDDSPSSRTGMDVCILGPDEWNEPSLIDTSDSRSAESQSVVSGERVKFLEQSTPGATEPGAAATEDGVKAAVEGGMTITEAAEAVSVTSEEETVCATWLNSTCCC